MSAIYIGNKITKKTAKNIASAVGEIFAAAAAHRMDRETILKALDVLGAHTGPSHIENVSLSNITVSQPHKSAPGDISDGER